MLMFFCLRLSWLRVKLSMVIEEVIMFKLIIEIVVCYCWLVVFMVVLIVVVGLF